MNKHLKTAIHILESELFDLDFKIKSLESEINFCKNKSEITDCNFESEIHACEYSKLHFQRLIKSTREAIAEIKKVGTK